MQKKKHLIEQNWFVVLIVFVITFLLLLALSWFEVLGSISGFWYFNYIAIVAFFLFGFFLFEFLQEKITFKFSDAYVGLILLVVLYLAFWLAFRFFYGNSASLNNLSFSDYYVKAGLNLFSSLINSPYIYIALSFFAGWLAFFIKEQK